MLKRYAQKILVRQLDKQVDQLLKSHDLTIIAVTGTVGKTGTKLAIGQVLEAAGRKVCYSEDSYNTDIGVPLAIFGLKVPARLADPLAWRRIMREVRGMSHNYPYDTIVIEVAEDERAMMAPWLERLKPHISVFTGASAAHMERFESIEQLRDDAAWLASQAERCFYNADMDLVREVMERRKGAVGYGIDHGVVQLTAIKRARSGYLQAELKIGKERGAIKTQFVARHSLSYVLAAAAVAHELGVDFRKICSSIANVRPVIGRMRLLAGVNDSRVLDDSYNSSPVAVKAALDALMELTTTRDGRRIAVLGSMNELGEFAADLHREVGVYAAEKHVDMLVTVGKDAMNLLAPAAIEAGLAKNQVKQFRTPYEAGHYLKSHVKPGDIILVKGSQNGVFTEETSRILLSPELHPAKELVRQSASWKARKKKSFGI